MTDRKPCTRCGRAIAWLASGHARAHECPHGRACVLPYAKRRTVPKPPRCADCAAGRMTRNQLGLFEGGR